jgi:steroid delta-isomerase-like uncharacterized protein
MSVEESKALYRHFVEEVINNGKFDEIPGLYTEDYVDHSAPPGAPAGIDGVRGVFTMFRTAFPDVHFVIDDMVGENDLVATRVTGQGTQDGPFMAFPPSGRHAVWGSKGIFRVKDGKIAEHWGMPDLVALLGQIGALPPEAVMPHADTSDLHPRPDVPVADAHEAARIARNKSVASRISRAFTTGDQASVGEFVASDYVDHPPAKFFNVPFTGPASLQGAVRVFKEGFPDLVETVEEMVAEDNKVVIRSLWKGTHTGEFVGIPATGKPVVLTGINFYRVGEDGMLVERHGSFDVLGMMQQLGLVPSPGAAPAGAH